MLVRIIHQKSIRFVVVLLLVCAFAAFPQVYAPKVAAATAEEIQRQIDELEAKQSQLEESIRRNKVRIKEYEGDASKQKELQEEVANVIEEIKANVEVQAELITQQNIAIENKIALIEEKTEHIEAAKREIAEAEHQIGLLEAENEKNLITFAQIMKAMYMTGDGNTLDVLLGAEDFFDILVTTEMMKNIGDSQIAFMDQLMASIEEQQQMIAALEEKRVSLQRQRMQLETEKVDLEQDRDVLQQEKEALDNKIWQNRMELSQINTELEELDEEINKLQVSIDEQTRQGEALNPQIAELIRQKQSASTMTETYSSDGFLWPLDARFGMITTYFGYDAWRGGSHYGIDVGDGGIGGANIYAAQSGTVIVAKNNGAYNGGFGNYVIIDHGGGLSTVYAHGSSMAVSEGQLVEKGQVIGYVGATGWATGNHLHFEVRVNGTAVNPFNYQYQNRDY